MYFPSASLYKMNKTFMYFKNCLLIFENAIYMVPLCNFLTFDICDSVTDHHLTLQILCYCWSFHEIFDNTLNITI